MKQQSSLKQLDLSFEDSSIEMIQYSSQSSVEILEMIKPDGTMIFSYSKVISGQKIAEIHKQIIDYSRKLLLDHYDKEIQEIMVEGLYVYFRIKFDLIFVVATYQTWSLNFVQDIVDKFIKIFEQTVLQMSHQQTLPKTIPASLTSKLEPQINKKSKKLLKSMHENPINTPFLPSPRASPTKSEPTTPRQQQQTSETIKQSSQKAQDRIPQLKSSERKSEKLLHKSQSIKQLSVFVNQQTVWKGYLLYFYILVCLGVWAYVYTYHY